MMCSIPRVAARLTCTVVLVALVTQLHAAPPDEPLYSVGGTRIGLGGAGALRLPMGTLRTACDCDLLGKNGFGGAGLLLFERRLLPTLWLSVSAGFLQEQATWESEFTRMRFTGDGTYVEADVARKAVLSSSLGIVSISARWYPGLGALSLTAGPQLEIPLSSKYKETEELQTPGYVYFESGSSVVIMNDGPLSEVYDAAPVRLALRAAVSYDIPLGGILMLTPEIGYALPLSSIATDRLAWKVGGLDARAMLVFVL